MSTRHAQCPSRARNRTVIVLLACGAATWLFSGCTQPLNTMYGRTCPPILDGSVNGTDVLVGMFTEAGHKVKVRHTLITSEMESVDTIVWFPDDFEVPKQATLEWFDAWLSGRAGRTLVYVGRDFDAAPLYWQTIVPLVPADKKTEYRQLEVKQASETASRRPSALPARSECEWFEITMGTPRLVKSLSGVWSEGIDPAKVEIELGMQLVPPESASRLLTSGDDVLVSVFKRPDWAASRLITVANGSFLLNFPLVNHEHRKLAEELVKVVGPPGKVVFLESGPGGPPIDPPADAQNFWQLLGGWPLNVIVLHLAVLGIIFCFARWPIFGRPAILEVAAVSDFGKHVEAVGQLLRHSKDRNYALSKLPPDVAAAAASPETS